MTDRFPSLGVDCHVHLFDPSRFPYRLGTLYTPTPQETGTLAMLEAAMAEAGLSNAVFVGPMSGYQSDNTCLLDGLRSAGGRHRGIAIVEADVSDAYLDELSAAGVVGIRIDLVGRGSDYLDGEAWGLVERAARRDWILDLQCEAEQLSRWASRLSASGVRLVVDHVGRPVPNLSIGQPGFAELLGLAATGRCWVKLSGPFRFAKRPDLQDCDAFVKSVLAAFGPDRLVWGSDWPFLRMNGRYSHRAMLDWLERLVPNPSARRKIVWDTPSRLFGFVEPAA